MVTYHVQLMYVEMFIYQMHRSIYIQLDKGNYRSCVYNNNYTPCLGLSYHYAILPGDRLRKRRADDNQTRRACSHAPTSHSYCATTHAHGLYTYTHMTCNITVSPAVAHI